MSDSANVNIIRIQEIHAEMDAKTWKASKEDLAVIKTSFEALKNNQLQGDDATAVKSLSSAVVAKVVAGLEWPLMRKVTSAVYRIFTGAESLPHALLDVLTEDQKKEVVYRQLESDFHEIWEKYPGNKKGSNGVPIPNDRREEKLEELLQLVKYEIDSIGENSPLSLQYEVLQYAIISSKDRLKKCSFIEAAKALNKMVLVEPGSLIDFHKIDEIATEIQKGTWRGEEDDIAVFRVAFGALRNGQLQGEDKTSVESLSKVLVEKVVEDLEWPWIKKAASAVYRIFSGGVSLPQAILHAMTEDQKGEVKYKRLEKKVNTYLKHYPKPFPNNEPEVGALDLKSKDGDWLLKGQYEHPGAAEFRELVNLMNEEVRKIEASPDKTFLFDYQVLREVLCTAVSGNKLSFENAAKGVNAWRVSQWQQEETLRIMRDPIDFGKIGDVVLGIEQGVFRGYEDEIRDALAALEEGRISNDSQRELVQRLSDAIVKKVLDVIGSSSSNPSLGDKVLDFTDSSLSNHSLVHKLFSVMTAKQVKEVITKLGGEYDQALANENWGLMTQLQGKVQHVYWRVGGLVSLGNVMNRVQIGSYEVFYQEKQAELRRLQKESQEIGTSVQKRHEVSQAIGELKSLIEKTLQEKNLRRNKSIEAMVCYREIPRLKRLCQDECGDQRTVDRKKFTQVIVEMPEGVLLSEYGYKLDNPFLKLQKLQREVNEAFAALLGKTIA